MATIAFTYLPSSKELGGRFPSSTTSFPSFSSGMMSGPLSRALAGLLFVLMLVPGVSAASDDGMLVPDSAHAAAESETASVKRLRLAIVNSYGMSIMDDYYSRTIEAVKEKLSPIEIEVKIYGPDSFLKAAEKESFDMSIASSGLTSLMIERTGGLPLAAVVSDEAPDPNYANGAAIIVRADRPELRTLEDLRGRSVAIMSRTAFAGWQIPASEMVRKGLDPEAFFSEIRVSGYPMTRIVQEVKSGEVDVGFVATCLLERMARAGQIDQKDFRKEIILDFLKEKNCDPKTLNVIVGRGGLLKPIPGGTYAVSDALLADLKAGVQGQHASNLGGILAREIGDSLGVPSYIVDPVVVDELTDKARISGMPELPRRSIFHALNQKAVARRFAKENGKRYEDLNLIVIHMGGGVSVGAHDHGKVVDVNNILDGEGCFSPERSGTVPVGDLVKMCFSGKYTQKEVYKKICGNGGFNGYLHTNDAREVGKMAESGDALAKQVWDAFFYQIAKDAGAMAAVLHGKVDQIILTGGIAYNPFTAQTLTDYLGWIAPVTTYPGEDELLALCQGALRVMTGEEEAKNY